ncbi:cell envelope integrity protein TolA [Listeria monocytogenes]|nr:cell envelope integrity protein TolA [Listeria monocytogenes]
MTGLGTLLFLVGIGVLIFGLVSFRRKNWPRKKTQIIIISSILAIIIGVGIIPTTDEEASTEEPTKQEEKTEKVDNTPILKAETTFTTDDEGTLVVEGKTNPGAEVTLDFVAIPDAVTTADENGAFSLSVNQLDKAQDAVLSIVIDGQTKEQTLKLALTPAYETKLTAKAEAERVAAEKAEAERVERERVAAEEKRAADAKIAAEKKAEEARVAAEKKAAAAQPDTSNEQGQMVYITATGKRYHYDQNCRGLNNSNGETAVTVAQAKAQGLTLCKFEQ